MFQNLKSKIAITAAALSLTSSELSNTAMQNSLPNTSVASSLSSLPTFTTNLSIPSEHIVKSGDTLWSISNQYGFDLKKFQSWVEKSYGIKPTQLKVGQKLGLASFLLDQTGLEVISEYVVKPGDSLIKIVNSVNKGRQHSISLEDILYFNPKLASNPNFITVGLKLKIPKSHSITQLNQEIFASLDTDAKQATTNLMQRGVLWQKVLVNLFDNANFKTFAATEKSQFLQLLNFSGVEPIAVDALVNREIGGKPAILSEDVFNNQALGTIWEIASLEAVHPVVPAEKTELVRDLLNSFIPGILRQGYFGTCTAVSTLNEISSEHPAALASLILQFSKTGSIKVVDQELQFPADYDFIRKQPLSPIVRCLNPLFMQTFQEGNYSIAKDLTIRTGPNGETQKNKGMQFSAKLATFLSNVSGLRYEPIRLDDVDSDARRSFLNQHPEYFEDFLAGVLWTKLTEDEKQQMLAEEGKVADYSAHAIYVHKVDRENDKVYFYNSHDPSRYKEGKTFSLTNGCFSMTYNGNNLWSMKLEDFIDNLQSVLICTNESYFPVATPVFQDMPAIARTDRFLSFENPSFVVPFSVSFSASLAGLVWALMRGQRRREDAVEIADLPEHLEAPRHKWWENN